MWILLGWQWYVKWTDRFKSFINQSTHYPSPDYFSNIFSLFAARSPEPKVYQLSYVGVFSTRWLIHISPSPIHCFCLLMHHPHAYPTKGRHVGPTRGPIPNQSGHTSMSIPGPHFSCVNSSLSRSREPFYYFF